MRITKLALLAAFLCGFLVSPRLQAQDYKKLRIALVGGYGMRDMFGVGGSGGPVVSLEPAFRITDKILIGARSEAMMRVRSLSKPGAQLNPLTSSISWSMFGQYYFSKRVVRTFMGAGAGVATLSHRTITYHPDFIGPAADYVVGEKHPVYFVRFGLEASHFVVMLEYNYGRDEPVTPELAMKNSYAAIKLGLFIGGGFN